MLIEWMVHFLLLSILLLIIAGLLLSWHRNVIGMGRLCDNALSIYLAGDALRSDIHNAHTVIHDAEGLHIHYPHTDLGWLHDGNALWRQKSVYKQDNWNKPSKSLFARHINKCNFIIKSLPGASQDAALITWQLNEATFLVSTRNGLLI